ncbi:MAG: 2-C-methyl-D-erythritol 2,4-cyclodiphosphate synthase [Leptospiraceae bacterium]|nr:2-C-methyl-D-erythritol 2,4-cyclodiphosphate synthase [Leptospiraceae bacterium]MDW7975341.1 2-C-methyl-D-erythritol 2,4-cyclodiphosphate synthase [Leptospiraceae bacterium]
MQIRIGQGIDVHRIEKTNQVDFIRLGGVEIPSEYRIIAHSDGDILLHSLSDAILGAIGETDIGIHFPDTDSKNKNLDSKIILKHALQLMKEKNFEIGNIDITLLAEKPKIKPFREKIIEKISELCQIPKSQIAIKATTTEKLGFIGRSEGIACCTVVLLIQK